MEYLKNFYKHPWETVRPYFEGDFELAVRSASATQLLKALSELALDASGKAFVLREMDTRIGQMDAPTGEMESIDSARDYLPAMSLLESAGVMRTVVRYAGEKTAPDEAGLRLAALGALETALQRGLRRTDGEMEVVINGLSDEPIIAQRCAELVRAVRLDWPRSELDSREERFDAIAVPALQRNMERLGHDKPAKAKLLDALDHIQHGAIVDTDTNCRSHPRGVKTLRVPLLAEKLRLTGDRRTTA